MRKITTGFIGVFAILVLVAGIGFALFSSTATVSGLDLETATPGLEISANGVDFDTTLDASTLSFAPLLPGESDWGEFWLLNNSTGTTDPFDMVVTGELTAASGDWTELEGLVELRFCVYSETDQMHCDATAKTAWYPLMDWNAGAMEIPPELLQDETIHYAINLRLSDSADNDVAGMTIEDIEFTFVGTQVTE